MATKKDIAQIAGVSPATVSNFYNDKGKTTADTRQRIIAAAKSLNYPLPNTIKAKNNSKITFLIVDDLLNPHYGNILNGMNSVAVNYHIPVSMIQLWHNADAFCQMLIENGVYAVFFATYSDRICERHIELLRSNGIYVYFPADNFMIEFNTLMEKAIKYLVDLGHKDIAYLSGLSIDDPNNNRYQFYLDAMKSNGLVPDRDLAIDGIYPYFSDIKSGYWATKSFIEKKKHFTALVAMNDLLAIGAINALSENGFSIPRDVSVIGCDDIVLSEYTNPPLTTLRYSAKDIGIRAMYSIIQQEKDLTNCSPVVLQTELIIRKSSGKAPETP